MASSSGSSLNTSSTTTSQNTSFSFSSSFSDQIPFDNSEESNWGFFDSNNDGVGSSNPPQTPFSPSCFFTTPTGLDPNQFLDPPFFPFDSNIVASPTTGSFPGLDFNDEEIMFSDIPFQTQTMPFPSISTNMMEEQVNSQSQEWSLAKQTDFISETNKHKSESTQSVQTQYVSDQSQASRDQNRSEDGYNWRKYGEGQVEGSKNPRSYYKCTYLYCPARKRVERNSEGHTTKIIYKGNHCHSKPQNANESSSNSYGDVPLENNPLDSSGSFREDDFEQALSLSNSGDDDENEPEAKRLKGETESEAISGPGSRILRKSRSIVIQTRSDIDILDDGYRWKKYGQKVVKWNPNQRSYYKCTSVGCPVRKHVERAPNDLRDVITTYEGKHNHVVPEPRSSGSSAINRTVTTNNVSTSNDYGLLAIQPPAAYWSNVQNTMGLTNYDSQAPYPLQMLQNYGDYGIPENLPLNLPFMDQNTGIDGSQIEPEDDLNFYPYLR